MSRLTNDVDTIGQVLNAGLVQTLGSALLIVGIVVAMFSLNWQLALATFAILPFMFAVIDPALAPRPPAPSARRGKTIGSVSADLEENISGVRVAQAFAREDENIERFDELNRANRDANVSAQGSRRRLYAHTGRVEHHRPGHRPRLWRLPGPAEPAADHGGRHRLLPGLRAALFPADPAVGPALCPVAVGAGWLGAHL